MKIRVCILLSITLFLLGCKRESKYSYLQDKPLAVRILVADESNDISTRRYIGEIGSESEIWLSFTYGGDLIELNKKSGQRVEKGEVIARVDDTQFRAMYESAKAVLAQAEDGYERAKRVYEKGGINEIKWKEIETEVQKAKSLYVSTEKRLEDCTIRAVKSGVVEINDHQVGQTLSPSQRIGKLIDMNNLTARFTVPENEVGTMYEGQVIEVSIPALDLTTKAHIISKDLTSTILAHTFLVRALLDDKEVVKHLLPGMVCKAIVTNNKKRGIVVPASCIMTQKRGLSVWVIKQGQAQRRIIEVDEYVNNGVLVGSGLENGDTIVTEGYQKLFVGAKVDILD